MVPVLSLLLPILLSAVAVFLVSFILHMLLKYHQDDYRSLPDEPGVQDALRPFRIPPGNYAFPRPKDMKDIGSPEFKAKWGAGPAGFLIVLRTSPDGPKMTAELVQWFVYSIVVSIFAAYIAGRALEPGANYLEVFRFAGATAFIGYGLAQWQQSIWYKVSWTTTLKNNIDALIYGFFTGGVFGWLWP